MNTQPNQGKNKNTPELLLPAGNMETFKAAIAGEADAVYLGVKNFNARGRAQNFTWKQLAIALSIAKEHNAKVYVTLNTVIKNNEIDELIDTLNTLNQIKPDALIIQDWGVYFIIKNFFPGLPVHGSTQMGIHNSQGVNYAADNLFERVILARELTMEELQAIAQKSRTEIELFIHGALCYSFSGMCLYSSFIGGQGANRGLCKQPCRRVFNQKNRPSFPFSLKDIETIELIPKIKTLGISSLKVEGRLKSANYVYTVARAYKMVLQDNNNLAKAKEMLQMDMGRDKTSYFLGGKVTNSISDRTATGFELGQILKVTPQSIQLKTSVQLNKGDRIRVVHKNGEQTAFKISSFELEKEIYTINQIPEAQFAKNEKVYLASKKDIKLTSLEEPETEIRLKPVTASLKKQVLKSISTKRTPAKRQKKKSFYARINNLDWIKKVNFNEIEGLIIQLPPDKIDQLKTDVPFIKKNIYKIILELPAFIPEKQIGQWQSTINKQKSRGIKKFMISHLSQQAFFHPKDYLIANENIYTFNDAAIAQLQKKKVSMFTYPVENDRENLKNYVNKDGIAPIYFRPRLFFSRMPVKIDTNSILHDDYNLSLHYTKQNNLNYIYPQEPVSLTHYTDTLLSQGFKNFLVDFSFEKPSSNRWKTVLKRSKFSEQIQPAYSFNMKKGLI